MKKKLRLVAGALAAVALLAALGSSQASARELAVTPAPANSVNSTSIVNNSVDTVDVKTNTLGWTDFSATLQQLVYAQGNKLPANGTITEPMLAPAVKAKLDDKTGQVTGLESDGPYPGATQLQDGANSTAKWVANGGATLQKSWVMCPAGKVAIGGGYSRADESVSAFKDLQIVTSSPTQIKDGAQIYTPITGDADGSFVPNAWLVEGFNNASESVGTDLIVRPHVICAAIVK